ncbi:hypothetical protein BGZ49_004092, partial [Haplosporangium sp. Z 27]
TSSLPTVVDRNAVVPPTIYALASTVPNPTVNQLSTLPSHLSSNEKVAAPFKTILHTSATTISASTTPITDSAVGSHAPSPSPSPSPVIPGCSSLPFRNTGTLTFTQEQFPSSAPTTSTTSNTLKNPGDSRHSVTLDKETGGSGSKNNNDNNNNNKNINQEIHPYFAGCNIPERSKSVASPPVPTSSSPSLPPTSTATSTAISSPSTTITTNVSGQDPQPSFSPPPTTTSPSFQSSADFFNSTSLPEQPKIWNNRSGTSGSIDDNVLSEAVNSTATSTNEATAQINNNDNRFIGSRSTVFGFTPLNDNSTNINNNYSNYQGNTSCSCEDKGTSCDPSLTISLDRLGTAAAAAATAAEAASASALVASGGLLSKRLSISSASNASETDLQSDSGSLSSVSDSGSIQQQQQQSPQLQRCSSSENYNQAPHARAGISANLNLEKVEESIAHSLAAAAAASKAGGGGAEGGGSGANSSGEYLQPCEDSVESLYDTKDWSSTGLGPRSEWPIELTLLIKLMMKSASQLAIYWGDESYLLYND